MELLLLGIYSFFAWLIFFKFKWLPWNITSQVIVVTIPIIILFLFTQRTFIQGITLTGLKQ